MQIKITTRSPEDYEKTIARLQREGCKLESYTEEASYWKTCLCTYTVIKARGEAKVSNKEILEVLAETECKLFYAKCQEPENEVLRQLHKAVKELLLDFHNKTGATL